VNVEITPEASKLIRSKGGRLFLWTSDVAQGWETDQKAFAPPPDVQFQLHEVPDCQLYVETGIALPDRLEIRRGSWPFRRLKVLWDGRLWGARGDWGTREPGATGPG
jgi:hypothetical protein